MNNNYRKYFIIILFFVLGVFLSSTFCYGAIASTMKVSGIANTRFTKDVRVTRFSISECSSGTISSYEEFNKDSISTHIKFPNYNSYIIYNVSVRNYGNVKMGIKEILGKNSNLNYELIDYKLHDVIKDVNGNTKGGATKNFKIKISPRNTLDANVNLTFKFAMIYDVTYTLIQDNNYPKEAMEGVDFNLTFTEPIPKYLEIFINGNKITDYTYTNPKLTIKAVNGNINIKLSEKVYLKESIYREDFKSDPNVRNQIKTVSFVKYDNSSDSTNIGTWDMSEGQDKSVMAWLDKNYNLFIGSKYKIYGKNFYCFFSDLSAVTSFDFSNLDTSEATSMTSMFDDCISLTSLNISNFDIRNVKYITSMFSYVKSIKEITIGNNYVFSDQDAFPESKYGKWFNSNKQPVSLEQISGVAGTYRTFFKDIQLPFITSIFKNSSLKNLTGTISFSNKKLPSGTPYDISLNDDNNSVVAVINGQDAVIYNTISDGKVGVISSCNEMFYNFNIKHINLTNLNTSNVTDMSRMFLSCYHLISLDLTGIETSNVKYMRSLFSNCRDLEKLDLSGFKTGNVTDMYEMFGRCDSLTSLDLSKFDTPNLTNTSYMFTGCFNLKTLYISNFNVSKVYNMSNMFKGCHALSYLDLSSFDLKNVSHFTDAFSSMVSLSKIRIGSNYNLNDSKGVFRKELLPSSKYGTWYNSNNQLVTPEQISGVAGTYTSSIPGVQAPLDQVIFRNAKIVDCLGKISFSKELLPSGITNPIYLNDNNTVVGVINGDNVTIYNTINPGGVLAQPNCTNLFSRELNVSTNWGSNFTSLDLSGFNTSNVTDMNGMLEGSGDLKNINFGSMFDTSNVIDMSSMFSYSGLKNLDLTFFDTRNVKDMGSMFSGCNSLTSLDLSSFDFTQVEYMNSFISKQNNKALTVYYNTQASLDKIKASSNLNSNITFVQKNAPV